MFSEFLNYFLLLEDEKKNVRTSTGKQAYFEFLLKWAQCSSLLASLFPFSQKTCKELLLIQQQMTHSDVFNFTFTAF